MVRCAVRALTGRRRLELGTVCARRLTQHTVDTTPSQQQVVLLIVARSAACCFLLLLTLAAPDNGLAAPKCCPVAPGCCRLLPATPGEAEDCNSDGPNIRHFTTHFTTFTLTAGGHQSLSHCWSPLMSSIYSSMSASVSHLDKYIVHKAVVARLVGPLNGLHQQTQPLGLITASNGQSRHFACLTADNKQPAAKTKRCRNQPLCSTSALQGG